MILNGTKPDLNQSISVGGTFRPGKYWPRSQWLLEVVQCPSRDTKISNVPKRCNEHMEQNWGIFRFWYIMRLQLSCFIPGPILLRQFLGAEVHLELWLHCHWILTCTKNWMSETWNFVGERGRKACAAIGQYSYLSSLICDFNDTF